jgi:PAS domain S-box-containing protein
MLALKEFVDFMTQHKANLTETWAQLLAEPGSGYAHLARDSRLVRARRLLTGMIACFETETSQPLFSLLTEHNADVSPFWELECLGQTLTPVVTNLEAGRFLWQILGQVRLELSAPTQTLAQPTAGPEPTAPVTPEANQGNLSEPSQLNPGRTKLAAGNEGMMVQPSETSEEKYRTILESIKDGYYEVDLAGNLTFFNQALAQLLGYPAPELLGLNNRAYTDEENARKLFQVFNQVFRTGQPSPDFDLEVTRPDGSNVFIEVSCALIVDSDGEPAGFRGVARDITERQAVQKNLAASLKDLEDQAQKLMILNQMGPALAKVAGLPEILEVIKARTRQVVDGDQVTVTLLNETEEHLDYYALSDEAQPLSPLPLANSLVGEVMRAEQVALTPDLRRVAQRADAQRWLEQGFQSAIIAPLSVGGRPLGALAVVSRTADPYTQRDEILIGQVATMLAAAIENRRFLVQIQQRARQLEAVAEVSTAASTILEPDRLIEEAVNLIRDRFEFYYVGLFLLDESGAWAVLRAGTGEAGRLQLERKHRLAVNEASMIGWSVANSQARIALDVGQDAVRFQNPILPDTRSEMAIPLISRGEVLGALTIQSVRRNAFTDADITVLQTMADQLANAIANARLYEQTQRRARREQTIREISDKLRAAPNLELLLETAARELGSHLHLQRARLTLGVTAGSEASGNQGN